jgi:hypothetical protein
VLCVQGRLWMTRRTDGGERWLCFTESSRISAMDELPVAVGIGLLGVLARCRTDIDGLDPEGAVSKRTR